MFAPIDASGARLPSRASDAPYEPITTPQAAIEQAEHDHGAPLGGSYTDIQINLEASRTLAIARAQQEGRYGDIAEIERSYDQAKVLLPVREILSHRTSQDELARLSDLDTKVDDPLGSRWLRAVEANLEILHDALARLADGAEQLPPGDAVEVLEALGPVLSRLEDATTHVSDLHQPVFVQTGRLAMIALRAGDHDLFDALVERGADSLGFGDARVDGLSQYDAALDAMPFYLAVARRSAADGGEGAHAVVTRVLSGFTEYSVSRSVDRFVEHSAELQFLIDNAGSHASPEALAGAVDAYIAERSPEWREDYRALRADLAQQGERLLRAQAAILEGAPAHRQAALLELLNASSDAQFAISIALAENPGLVAEPELVALRNGMADAAGLGTNSAKLMQALGTAYLQQQLAHALDAGINRSGGPNGALVIANLKGLRDEGLAKALGLSPTMLKDAIDQLDDLEKKIASREITTAAQMRTYIDTELRGNVEKSKAFSPDTPVGRIFVGLTAILAGVTFWATTESTIENGIGRDFFAATVAGLTVGQQGSQFFNGIGVASDASRIGQFAKNADFARMLGFMGAGIAGIDAVREFGKGHPVEGSLFAFSAFANSFGLVRAGSRAGIWGTVAGTAAAIVSTGILIDRQRDEANQYENAQARGFLQDLGYSEEAAEILSNNAGNGASPVPVLMRWAAEDGLSPSQTVAFFNDLVARDGGGTRLAEIRDRIHDALEENEGKPGEVESSGEFDQGDRLDFASYATAWQMEHPSG